MRWKCLYVIVAILAAAGLHGCRKRPELKADQLRVLSIPSGLEVYITKAPERRALLGHPLSAVSPSGEWHEVGLGGSVSGLVSPFLKGAIRLKTPGTIALEPGKYSVSVEHALPRAANADPMLSLACEMGEAAAVNAEDQVFLKDGNEFTLVDCNQTVGSPGPARGVPPTVPKGESVRYYKVYSVTKSAERGETVVALFQAPKDTFDRVASMYPKEELFGRELDKLAGDPRLAAPAMKKYLDLLKRGGKAIADHNLMVDISNGEVVIQSGSAQASEKKR